MDVDWSNLQKETFASCSWDGSLKIVRSRHALRINRSYESDVYSCCVVDAGEGEECSEHQGSCVPDSALLPSLRPGLMVSFFIIRHSRRLVCLLCQLLSPLAAPCRFVLRIRPLQVARSPLARAPLVADVHRRRPTRQRSPVVRLQQVRRRRRCR